MAKIMLVEDDNSLRQIYADRLAAEGYEIISAKDGEEALAMAIKQRPDLIIADIMMPKVSGFDMLDILRSTTETKDTKIIMMTALSQAEDKVRAEKLGADKYLVKSQVTLEDVAREAGEMLNAQESAANSAVSGMTGDQTLADVEDKLKTPSADQAAIPAPAPTTGSIPVVTPPSESAATAQPVSDPAQATTADPSSTAAASTPTPASAPLVEPPATTSSSPTPEPEAPANTVTTTPSAETTLDQAKNLSTPAAQEEAVMKNQIDDFIASNPTLSSTAQPNQEQPPAPSSPPKTSIPVTEPKPETAQVPTNTDTDQSTATEKAIDGMLDGVEDNPEDQPSLKSAKAGGEYVSDKNDDDSGKDESTGMKHTKRIEPDASLQDKKPDINELLAKESDTQASPPAVGSEVMPGGGSISQLKDTNQNIIPQQNTSVDQPSDGTPGSPDNISI